MLRRRGARGGRGRRASSRLLGAHRFVVPSGDQAVAQFCVARVVENRLGRRARSPARAAPLEQVRITNDYRACSGGGRCAWNPRRPRRPTRGALGSMSQRASSALRGGRPGASPAIAEGEASRARISGRELFARARRWRLTGPCSTSLSGHDRNIVFADAGEMASASGAYWTQKFGRRPLDIDDAALHLLYAPRPARRRRCASRPVRPGRLAAASSVGFIGSFFTCRSGCFADGRRDGGRGAHAQPRARRRALAVAFNVGAVLAASTGWFLGSGEGYSGALLDEHRRLGIATGVAAAIVGPPRSDRWSSSADPRPPTRCVDRLRSPHRATGHHGGMITHGQSFLEPDGPGMVGASGRARRAEPLRGQTRADGGPRSPWGPRRGHTDGRHHGPDLSGLVAAFERLCVECHCEAKSKGDLRFDIVDGWLVGADVEDPELSELLYRVTLPPDDPDAMPPNGERLDGASISSPEAWMLAGAHPEPIAAALGGR